MPLTLTPNILDPDGFYAELIAAHEELSEEKTTPLGTVKSWIRRGLTSLRKCLDGLS